VRFFVAPLEQLEGVADKVVHRMTHELLGQLALRNETFGNNPITAEQMGDLIDSVENGTITGMVLTGLSYHEQDI
jgi:aspartyl-tRNA(Asn)/glutamyl-tRNA(Gln) amidotransferase subunit B